MFTDFFHPENLVTIHILPGITNSPVLQLQPGEALDRAARHDYDGIL